ncbi:MAG: hypothetical protein GX985_08560 [Gallicola sp.]|uniref:hypothetical protein n=1 Tax=Gallicola sp. Sow4_E12 TaxID=3438785 RepID=UPI0018031FF2|nr:hypothetical protein [Gallicola sp.]
MTSQEKELLLYIYDKYNEEGKETIHIDYYDEDVEKEESYDRSGDIDNMLAEMISEDLIEEKARTVGFVEVSLTQGGIAMAKKLKNE